jgi:serine/threonine protein kinase
MKATIDWWALGILTYELITGNTPFGSDDFRILSGKLDFTMTYFGNRQSGIRWS